jgi:hypothetical protein
MPSTMPNVDSLTYPPAAHTQLRSATVVASQPQPKSRMSLSPEGDSGEKADRLRGGCIPCPVRLINSIAEFGLIRFSRSGRGDVLHYTVTMLLSITGIDEGVSSRVRYPYTKITDIVYPPILWTLVLILSHRSVVSYHPAASHPLLPPVLR